MKLSLVTTTVAVCFAAATLAYGGARRHGSTSPASRAAIARGEGSARSLAATSRATKRRLRRAPEGVGDAGASTPDAGTSIPPRYAAFASTFDLETKLWATPGAAVAIIEHGKTTFTHAYGTAGPTSTTPVDADTIFRVGTMTQPLTVAAELALLDHAGGSVAETVTSQVPGVTLGSPFASLTMQELLSDRSGLFDFTQLSGDATLTSLSCTDPSSPSSFVSGSTFANNEFFATSPGAVYTGSNPNFILGGAAIESQSGKPFAAAMDATLFSPLGMHRTFFDPSDVVSAGDYSDGLGYDASGNLTDITPSDYDCVAYRPYGYAFSSVNDYAKFVELLLEGNPSILSEKSRAAMESAQAQTRDVGTIDSYGYGVTVAEGYLTQANVYYPTKVVSAVGAISGYASAFYFLPETGFGVVFLANSGSAQFVLSLDAAVESFGGLPASAPLPSGVHADPTKLARYVGTYEDPTGALGTAVVTQAGGALSIDFTEAAADGYTFWPQLSPVLADSFLFALEDYPYVIEFLPDEHGEYSYLLFDDLIPLVRATPDGGTP